MNRFDNLPTSTPKIIIAYSQSSPMTPLFSLLMHNTTTFKLLIAHNGLEALAYIEKNHDSACIILESHLEYLDGFKITKLIKNNFMTYHIPTILLIDHAKAHSSIDAVEAGADDYISTPCTDQELQTRLIMNLRRAHRDQNTHPLTQLPSSAMLTKIIRQRLEHLIAVLYIDIDNFKIYNDKYGFEKGDTVIQSTGQLLASCIQEAGHHYDFLGHIGGDDFVIVSHPAIAENLAKLICEKFDQQAPSFYNEHDRYAKKIIAQDRRGTYYEYHLMTVSIALISNEQRKIESIVQLAEIAAELKRYAKKKPSGSVQSNYVKDRRKQ